MVDGNSHCMPTAKQTMGVEASLIAFTEVVDCDRHSMTHNPKSILSSTEGQEDVQHLNNLFVSATFLH